MHASTPAALKDPSPHVLDVRTRTGSIVAGRFKLLRMIGEGGMGAVFEAEVLGSSERVAVKIIKPEYAMSSEVNGRFLQEVRAASAVGHPNIVQMLDAGSDAYGPFMVLELLKGETLCDVLDRRPLGPREALGVMAATIDALGAAHSVGVVHRDIKPENIFLVGGAERCSTVKLLDFGISKILSMQSAAGGITRVGTAVGTPDYMSPEQAGGGRVDGRADLWSVGAVLYESISLEHPFEGETYQQLISNIVLHAHVPLRRRVPAVPPELEAFIDRALRKEPSERYATAAEMLAEARRLLARLPPDESLGPRQDEPTSVMLAAPNEPTQVIDVGPAATPVARPQRHHRAQRLPSTETQPPPSTQVAQPAHVTTDPPPTWPDPSESATLHAAPAHAAHFAPPVSHTEERSSLRRAIPIVAGVAALLVAGVVVLRIRAATRPLDEGTPPAAAPLTPSIPPPPPLPPVAPETQVLNPTTQVLAPTAQVLNPTTQVLARPIAPSPQTPTPTVRVASAPTTAPVRRVAPAPPAPLRAGAQMDTLRTALPGLRSCTLGAQRYVGNVDARVTFDPHGRARSAIIRTPSRMTVFGACMVRALEAITVPSAAGATVPVFHTFR